MDNYSTEDDEFNARDDKNFVGPPLIEFPVDLKRDEFIEFNVEISKTGGSLRKRGRYSMFLGVVIAVFFLMFIYDLLVNQTIDFYSLGLILVWGFLALVTRLFMPNAVKKNASKFYDKTVLSGHSYFGMIRIFNDYIEKVNDENEVAISYRDNIFYFENVNLIGVLVPGKPAIILPARCLTPDDVVQVRRILLPVVPLPKQYISAQLIPLASGRMEKPVGSLEGGWENEEVCRVSVAYTREELKIYNGNIAFMGIVKNLPVYLISGLSAALIVGFIAGPLPGVIAFISFVLAILLIKIIFGSLRAKSLAKRMQEGNEFLIFEISEIGIIIKSTWTEENINGITWESITKATTGDIFVDFYTDAGFLSIPKRCIIDYDKFESVVNKFYPRQKN